MKAFFVGGAILLLAISVMATATLNQAQVGRYQLSCAGWGGSSFLLTGHDCWRIDTATGVVEKLKDAK